MNGEGCVEAIGWAQLVAYLGRDLEAAEEAALEEHFFACADCAARLNLLADLGDGIAALAGTGRVFASVTQPLLDRAAAGGLRMRSYRLAPQQSVACTIAPDDDANVIRLTADLAGCDRVDLDVFAVGSGGDTKTGSLEDLAFDGAAHEVVLLYPGDAIRALPASTHRLELVGWRGDARVRLGAYTLNHSPWPGEGAEP